MEAPEGEALDLIIFLGLPDLHAFRKMVFQLRYKRHGGSGTNLTHTDIMGFEHGRILEEWDFLQEAWEAENKTLKT